MLDVLNGGKCLGVESSIGKKSVPVCLSSLVVDLILV